MISGNADNWRKEGHLSTKRRASNDDRLWFHGKRHLGLPWNVRPCKILPWVAIAKQKSGPFSGALTEILGQLSHPLPWWRGYRIIKPHVEVQYASQMPKLQLLCRAGDREVVSPSGSLDTFAHELFHRGNGEERLFFHARIVQITLSLMAYFGLCGNAWRGRDTRV